MVLFVSGHHSRNAFDRTYEGLKLPLGKVPRGHDQAFDRTCEGLKPAFPRQGRQGPPPFDRTYEGLKQAIASPGRRTPRRLLWPWGGGLS